MVFKKKAPEEALVDTDKTPVDPPAEAKPAPKKTKAGAEVACAVCGALGVAGTACATDGWEVGTPAKASELA